MRVIKALGAAIMVAAVLAGPPWALVRFIGNPWPVEGVSLSAPLTDGAIVGLLAAMVWVLWAQLVACIVVEAIAALTKDRIQLRVPFTLAVQHHFARRLITALVLVAVSSSVTANTAAAVTAHAPAPEKATQTTGLSLATAHQQTRHHTGQQSGDPGHTTQAETQALAGREHPTVTVMRLDSLWSIAERTLGDGDRWPEIAALNERRTMSDGTTFISADRIKPGWHLRVPPGAQVDTQHQAVEHQVDEHKVLEHRVVVEAGDTLSQIALEELGDAAAYPQIFKASKDIAQPGGRHLVDPDVIDVGWAVEIPGQDAPVDPAPMDPAHVDHETEPEPGTVLGVPPTHQQPDEHPAPTAGTPTPSVTEAPSPDAPATDDAQPHNSATADSATADRAQQDGEVDGSITALRSLLATAVCLSVGAFGLVAANRRRQFRRRRIGRTIASTPPELAEVEQAILEYGPKAQDDVEFLDRALRHVAACRKAAGNPLPQLGAAVLGGEDLTLLFTHPAAGEVPEGWAATDDSRAWMLPRRIFLTEDLETQAAPYPALVTVGQDEGGRTWLLDLEILGVCGIGGEPEQVAEMARFLVAELAVNAWSEGSDVLLVDPFGAETIGLNPARLRQVDPSDALARAAVLTGEIGEVEQNLGADVLTRRRDGLLLDTTHPVVVVVASRPQDEFVADLENRVRSRVVIVHGDANDAGSPAVELTGDGMAFLPRWGINLKAFTLATSEAQAMAALLASTRNLEDEPVPATDSDDGPLGKYARANGALREEYTAPRHSEGDDPSSLLPDADEVYLATAATTAEDLAQAAPSVPEQTRAAIETLDPNLDQDVADWFDESSPRPKVHLLGPVEVTALHGGDPQAIDNAGGTISFIAYLACQDRGVTGERAAAACGWKTQKTVQNRATNARFLLGTRPDGSDWLPDASMSDEARRGTTPTYELIRGSGGVLNSADLFVRLRLRAQKRGANGCEEDLVTALSLVTGAPFEAATEHRFKWLFRPWQQRHDEILVGAIHDAAHLLATRALAHGRTDLVRLACNAAHKASPHSDVVWLDLAAATEAESGQEAAYGLVREQVLESFDEDLPTRTEAVLDQRDWATG